MDNPNITTEEYIRLEEEKARQHGKVYNRETATYGKIWYDEDVHDLRSIETKFLVIAFNDKLTSEEALSCEPTVSPLNDNEIDFRISFDESDDEDYTENNNDKVNMPLFPPPEPKVSYFDDLDFLKDFENEFPAIVYNDALTSKSYFSTEPVEIPHRIDEFDLKTETSLPERDEKEQNILYFNDLFPFNIIYPDDLKLEKDNDNEINIIQSSWGNEININTQGEVAEANIWLFHLEIRGISILGFEGYYTDANIMDFKIRLGKIYKREIHRVHVFDFGGLSDMMAEGLSGRIMMEHKDA
ncbi:hypothetical protein Tco_1418230 [Tanacetum coccineum]